MVKGTVVCLSISAEARQPMQEVPEVYAEAGKGLVGDRYHGGTGSYNKQQPGHRQVTLMNSRFFVDSQFQYRDSRRNIFTEGIELMWLIRREFTIGDAVLRGVKYCDPCKIPSKLAGIETNFADEFHDRGGLIAEVLKSGLIRIGDKIIPPPKGY
jgi:MOSC domain-containing protein YiiM